jgi:hypothetical protein
MTVYQPWRVIWDKRTVNGENKSEGVQEEESVTKLEVLRLCTNLKWGIEKGIPRSLRHFASCLACIDWLAGKNASSLVGTVSEISQQT